MQIRHPVHQRSVTQKRFPRNRDKSRATTRHGVDRRGDRVVNRPDSVERERGKVCLFPCFERPDDRLDSDRARSADCRELQYVERFGNVERTNARTLREKREARLVEHVHAVVARHRVAAQSNGNTGGEQLVEWRDSMPELRVRRRAVRHTRLRTCNGRDIALVDAHAVNEQWSSVEDAERCEELNRRRCS